MIDFTMKELELIFEVFNSPRVMTSMDNTDECSSIKHKTRDELDEKSKKKPPANEQ